MIIKQNSNKIDKIKIYAYQADEMKAIWLAYGHEPDLEEFQVSARDVK